MPAPTVVAALAAALAHDPGRPFITFYDGATGERTELSVKTFDNWVCKIANLLTDELMLDPGETISLHLPPHWQSTVIITAAWTAGLQVSGTGGDASLMVIGPESLHRSQSFVGPVLACSLRPMAGPFLEPLPDGWLDFATEVPHQPDVLLNPSAIVGADPAVLGIAGPVSHADLVAQAVEEAALVGLSAGGRLVTDANPTRPSGLVPALVAPLVVDAAVVLVANTDAHGRTRISEQERATTSWWLSG